MKLTKIEKNYLKKANNLEASVRRGLRDKEEAFNHIYGYNQALTDNGLNTEKTDCMFLQITNILIGTEKQEKASLIMLKMFTEWEE